MHKTIEVKISDGITRRSLVDDYPFIECVDLMSKLIIKYGDSVDKSILIKPTDLMRKESEIIL
jgi:hypothetical protein